MRFRMHAALVPLLLCLPMAGACFAQETPPEPRSTPAPAAAPVLKPDTLVAVPPPPAPGKTKVRVPPAPRTAWMFGAGLGYGWGGVESGDQKPDKETSGTTHLRVGCAFQPEAVIGIEYASWFVNQTDTTSWHVQVAGPALTWYWGHFFARGMIGWSAINADFAVKPPATGEVDIRDDGFAFLAGGGYEYRFRRRLGIAPQVDYFHSRVIKGTSAKVLAASIQFNWYY